MTRLLLMFCTLMAACGQVDYDAAPVGRFDGTLFVMWIDEGGRAGDGRFVYVPNPRDPLRLTRAAGQGSVQVIQPEMMYTDGGSVPRAGQLFNGLNPWGYAPAYMVHDWIFVARHCLTDGTPTKREETIAAMTFQESAEVIAEAIKTLIASGRVRENDVAPRVIAGAVAGPVSYDRWTVEGACAGDRVSEADRAAALSGVPGASQARLRGMKRLDADGKPGPVKPARLVSVLSF